MKTEILDIQGKKKGLIELPKSFSGKIREDIVYKVLEAKRRWQPYSASLVAGKQHAAKGKTVHRRHVWRSGYDRGQSRVPRKIFSRKGSQFNWEGAEVPQAKGGMRAHPPKVISMVNTKKINKKEVAIAISSALSATANKKLVASRYETLSEKNLKELPLVVESKLTSLKTKDLLSAIKKIVGEELSGVAIKKKKVRSGKGKLRGRKYKRNAGILLVTGNKEKVKAKVLETKNVAGLGINDLAKGGLGRLTIYTEDAINELNKKFEGKKLGKGSIK